MKAGALQGIGVPDNVAGNRGSPGVLLRNAASVSFFAGRRIRSALKTTFSIQFLPMHGKQRHLPKMLNGVLWGGSLRCADQLVAANLSNVAVERPSSHVKGKRGDRA